MISRKKPLAALLLTGLLALVMGWTWERHRGGNFDRRLLADGYRSVAVPAHDYELLPLRPGDRVDVLVVFDAVANNVRKKYAATLLQNVKVLGTRRSGKLDEKGVAYLMLNPIEAQYAALGPSQGETSVILRKTGDAELHPFEVADFSKLFR
jgi:Flp pilus assembly protein CpaB